MDLSGIKATVAAIQWLLTLGRSELRQVRTDTEELLNDLRKSLVNLWDVTTEVTKLAPKDLTADSFRPVYEYFVRFYLDPQSISAARTHCGHIARDVDRITFKLSSLLHTDLGRWQDARRKLGEVVNGDSMLLASYDACIQDLDDRLTVISDFFEQGKDDAAREAYRSLRMELRPDVRRLRTYVAKMEQASQHLWSVTA